MNQLPSLLDDNESDASFGLMQAFFAPTPSTAGLRERVANPAPEPPAAPAMPSPGGGGGAAPPLIPDAVQSPMAAGFTNAGLGLLEQSMQPTKTPTTVGQMIAAALTSGVPAYLANKEDANAKTALIEQAASFKETVTAMLKAKEIDVPTARLALAMGPAKGLEHLRNLAAEKQKPHVVGSSMFDGQGKLIARDVDPTQEIDGALYQLDANGVPLKGADGKVLPPIIKKDQPFDIAKIDPRTREAIQVVLKRDPRDPTAFGAPLSDEESARVRAYVASGRAGEAPKNSVTVMNDSYGAAVGRTMGEAWQGSKTAAREARTDLQVLTRMETLMQKPLVTGSAANARIAMKTLARTLGFTGDGAEDRTKEYLMNVSKRVMPMARKLAPVTEVDVSLLQRINGGDLSMTQEDLRKVMEYDMITREMEIADHNDQVERSTLLDPSAKPDLKVDLPAGYRSRLAAPRKTGETRIGPDNKTYEIYELNGKKGVMQNGTFTPVKLQ